METFHLRVYCLLQADWQLQNTYAIESKSLAGAVNRLARTLGVKFRDGVSKDGKVCWSLGDPPNLQAFYLQVYRRDRSKGAGPLDLLYKHVQNETIYAVSEASAMRQFRAYTAKRFKYVLFDANQLANRYDCQSHAAFVFTENPNPE